MRALVYGLFFLSGACGLIYEIVWSRLLTQILGSTVLAVGVVLAAFMSGLAIGGSLLGRAGDRSRDPLRLYAACEIGIAFAAVASLFLMDRSAAGYLWLHRLAGGDGIAVAAARFALAFALVLIPTILMGGTLPILSRFVIRKLPAAGAGLSSLYAVNTLGAVAGALLAGFHLVGTLGIHGAVFVAAAGNLGIGGAALVASLLGAAPGPPDPQEESGAGPPADVGRRILWGIGLSGFASFAYEVLWTRALVHLTGNSTYAFTLMLTVFLSGIALGGFLVRFLLRRPAHRVRWFGLLQVLAGLSAAAALPLAFRVVDSPAVREFLGRASGGIGTLALSTFAVAAVILLLPATFLGASFPLVGSLFVDDLRRTGARVGTVYAANTLGNVAGALAPAMLILPTYGIQKGIVLMSALNLGVGLYVLLAGSRRVSSLRYAIPLLFLAVLLALPWARSRFQFPSEYQTPGDRVLYYREGLAATTKVFQDPDTGAKRMSIDGVVIGGTEFTDYKQQVLAHLPKLLRDQYRSELSIGLGSGILIGESLEHPDLERLVCVEIEPSVVEGAAHFSEENHGVLQDPRARIVVDDVGAFLRTTTERYDIISADEKTADRFAANGFSYSRDYYRLLREHLAEDGVVIQWVPNQLPSRQYRTVLATFARSFPEVALLYLPPLGKGGPTNTLLLGSAQPIPLDPAFMNDRLGRDPAAFAGLRKYGIETAEAILAHYVAGGEAIRTATRDARENSLEHPYYEFYSPSEYALPVNQRVRENHDLLVALRGAHGPGELEGAGDRLLDAARAEDEFLSGLRGHLEGWPDEEITARFDRALTIAPWNDNLRSQIFSYLWNRGGVHYLQGENAQALRMLGRAVEIYPALGEAHYHHGLALQSAGDATAAWQEMRRALDLDPGLLPPRRALASELLSSGQFAEAELLLQQILQRNAEDLFALVTYGVLRAEWQHDFDGAQELLERARRIAPAEPSVIDARGWVAWLSGDREEARRIVIAGGRYDEGNAAYEARRRTVLESTP